MRLLLFNLATDADDPILGFATRWLCAIAERVASIHVITMRCGRLAVPDNVHVHSVGKEKGFSEPRRLVEFYRILTRILREDRVDVCFSHMNPLFTVLAAPVVKAKSIPIVTWYAHRQVTTILKLAHRLSDKMVSCNDSSYPWLHDKFASLGHGIDTNLFSPATIAADKPPLLLSVGRLSLIKGLMTLLEAVHLVRQRGYSIRCVLVGDASERDSAYSEALRQKARALNLEDVVQFVGAVPNDRVAQWYQRSFAHVNCSPPDHSLDKAVLEAMACGKPSLSSTLGFKETMGKWADRLLFQHGNSEDLAKKIEWLLRLSDVERQAIGKDVRLSAMKRHNLEQLAGRLAALLSCLITEQERRRKTSKGSKRVFKASCSASNKDG